MAGSFDGAGIRKGVVSFLPAGREVGEHLVRHPNVDKVAFTGSTAAGRRIAAICGEQLKRYRLPLGGEAAAVLHSGQAGGAQTRILARKQRYAEVVDALGAMVDSMQVGDPSDPATEIG